jgi:hypothetical protein
MCRMVGEFEYYVRRCVFQADGIARTLRLPTLPISDFIRLANVRCRFGVSNKFYIQGLRTPFPPLDKPVWFLIGALAAAATKLYITFGWVLRENLHIGLVNPMCRF